MAFNELEAIQMIDEGKMTDEEIKFLVNTRNGVLANDTAEVTNDKDAKIKEEMIRRGFVQMTSLSHPRATVTVDILIPTEPGITILNLFDKRFRENTGAAVDANTAPDVDPKLVKAPTDEEARKVPSTETKPLSADEKNLGYVPLGDKEAMKDPLVATGARDVNAAENVDQKVIAKNATVTVEKK